MEDLLFEIIKKFVAGEEIIPCNGMHTQSALEADGYAYEEAPDGAFKKYFRLSVEIQRELVDDFYDRLCPVIEIKDEKNSSISWEEFSKMTGWWFRSFHFDKATAWGEWPWSIKR